MIRWPGVIALVVSLAIGPRALAAPVTLEGLTFSDELGGFELRHASGKGTLDDPFVLVEDITAPGPAILTIRGMGHRFGNRIRSHHDVGFAMVKIVRNLTKEPWVLFNVELRELLDQASPFEDGLSFGQATDAGRPFTSDRFSDIIETREPFDGLQYVGGMVQPGESVTVRFVVTDTTPRWEFYLLQKRDSPIASLEQHPFRWNRLRWSNLRIKLLDSPRA